MTSDDVTKENEDHLGEQILLPNAEEIHIVTRKRTNAKQGDIIPPDGGWGWLVVLGAFCNTMMSSLLTITFTLVHASFFIEKRVSTTQTAWMFNVNQFTWNMFAFFGNSLSVRFGWRSVSFTGGLIMAASTVASVFIQEPWHLFISFSLFAGVGQGLCVVTALSIVPYYFDKKRGIAAGPPIAGISAAQFIGPLLVRHLLEQYDFRGTNLILGGILLNSCFFSLLYHPVEWHAKRRGVESNLQNDQQISRVNDIEEAVIHQTNELHSSTPILGAKERKRSSLISLDRISLSLERSSLAYIENSLPRTVIKSSETKSAKKQVREDNILKLLLKNLQVLRLHKAKIIAVSIPLILTAYMNFLMIVPLALLSKNLSLTISSWAMATAGLCNLIFRIAISALTDFLPISTKYYFMTGAFGIFVSMIMFTLTSNTTLIIMIMVVFGASVGSCGGLLSLIPLEFMGLEYTSYIFALYGLLNAIMFIVCGPFVGVIRDATQSYDTTLQVLSVVPLVAFAIWLPMPLAISSDNKREEKKYKKYEL